MLYVFQVDTGTMLTLHLDIAMESVKLLQKEIGKMFHIPPDKQVLLISGGEILDPNARVCSYSSGTDTNPIYLFSKMSIESATPPSASVSYSSETDLQELVEGSLNMPPTYETVVARAQLSLQFHDVAKEQLRVCEKLVHDQHLQHQGWAAVIANLEDITNAFKSRSDSFTKNFTDYLVNRQEYTVVLDDFPVILDLLSKIPLLQCLEVTEAGMMMSVASIVEIEENGSTSKPKTLLEWISAKDSGNSIEQVVQQCHLGLQQFTSTVHESLTSEVINLVEAINNPNMKEVKGLEDRLYGLEQLLFGARKKVQEQYEMSQGFVQNQNRVSNLRDTSVLPDLCSSHKKQLFVMLKNHQSLQDIHRRCTAAKEELSANLHTRLRWVMFVEKSISDLDNKLMLHHDTLKKLKRKMEIVRQIHSAPSVYAKAVVEVVRRKIFTRYFMDWAGSIAGESKSIHDEELGKRKEFVLLFKRHFLRTLFPGFDDSLPTFAVETPDSFDTSLPPITSDDIEYLRFEVPELAEELTVPDEDELAQKFSSGTIQASSSADVRSKRTKSSPTLSFVRADPLAPDIVVSQAGIGSSAAFVTRRTSESAEGNSEGVDSADLDKSVEVISSQCSINIKSNTDDADDEDEFMSLQPEGLPDPEPPVGAEAEVDSAYTSQNKRKSQDSLTPAVTTSKSDKTKSSAETSPDLEDVNSDGFTTADFYIDESMPSSMTESPPTKKMLELQQLLYERNVMLNSKEKALESKNKEVAGVKEQLEKAEEKFHLLHNIAHKGVLQLKCDVLSIEKHFFKDKDDFSTFMKMTVEKIQTVLNNFETTMKLDREKELDEINRSCEEKLLEYQSKLEMEMGKLADANREVALHQQNLSDTREQAEKLRQEMECKIAEINKKWAEDLRETEKNMMLESEVELEKARSDYELDLSRKDQEMEQLLSQLKEKDQNIQALIREKDGVVEELQTKFQAEKAEITKMLETMFEERKSNLEKEMEEKLATCRKSELERIARDVDEKILASCASVKTEKEKEKDNALQSLRVELEQKHTEEINKLSSELNAQKEQLVQSQDAHSKELERQKSEAVDRLDQLRDEHAKQIEILEVETNKKLDKLQSDHQRDKEHLKEEWRVKEEQIQGNAMSLEKHYDLVKQMKTAWEDEKHEAIKQAEIALQEAHQEAIDKLHEKMMREKSDSLQTMRTSFTAEKQTLFNEALNKVATEKDKIISDLQERERSLQIENEKLQAKLNETASAKSVIEGEKEGAVKRVKSMEDHLRGEVEKYKEEVTMLRRQFEQRPAMSDPLNIPGDHAAMGQSFMTQSVMPIEGSSPAERISVLEQKLKSKESEIVSMQEKLMTMSMSPATRAAVQDKVSITTCSVGDIVLLCLDERHDHYVVFNMGTTLHFLHTDCLETLNLKSRPGEPKKSWVLAEIIDKEYCQAKKAQNRFKVPLGTKFFRVKAKPWDRESALQRDHTPTTSASPQPSSSN